MVVRLRLCPVDRRRTATVEMGEMPGIGPMSGGAIVGRGRETLGVVTGEMAQAEGTHRAMDRGMHRVMTEIGTAADTMTDRREETHLAG